MKEAAIKSQRWTIVTLTVGAMLAAGALFAHHAHQVMANYDYVLGVTGVVTRHEFVNPHALIEVTATDEKGNIQVWVGYGGTPGMESRLGYSSRMFKLGEERITMYGFRNKDGRNFMIYTKLVRANGEDLPIYQTLRNDMLTFQRRYGAKNFKELPTDSKRYIGGAPYQATVDK